MGGRYWKVLRNIKRINELFLDYVLPLAIILLPVTSYQLPVTSYQLPVTSYQLPVTRLNNT
ncbi:hypothetical protein CR161_05600 [Prosthecochloris sp. ZM]|nr:hypothetical protein CR161_05600 [Prosthecochloris sp. ZM]